METEATDWRSRIVTADAAVAGVRPGARVFVGSASGTPRRLLTALAARPDAPAGIELVHFLTDGARAATAAGPTEFRHRTWFVGSDLREPGLQVDYVPLSVTDVPRLLDARRIELDVAFIQVRPPDADGTCSLGVSVDITHAAALAAGRIVAEVNPRMPHTGPASTIPVDRIDAFVEVDEPVIEYTHPPIGAVAEQIARYVARLVDDGATLQVGLGRVPNELLRYLGERRGLRIHSDVLTDPIIDLLDAGALSGSILGSMAMGTRRLYDLLDGNPNATLAPIEVVADPATLATLPRLASVTQAFSVDLAGQVCTEQQGGERYGGLAAQTTFHRGAAASPGGKAMVCLASTAADGTSTIRARLEPDEPVAIARGDVHWVITEYGIAYLHGRSIAERAVALIEVAHPDHRERLLAEAVELGVLDAGQKLRSRVAYPVGEEHAAELRDGRQILVRPTLARDAGLLQDLFFRMRDEDVRTRFFRRLRSLTDEMAQHLSSVGFETEMAFAAVVGDREAERIVGSACAYVDASSGMADVAYMVDPAWQGSGLGSVLQDRLVAFGRRKGLRGFTADVLAENAPMLKVFRRSGLRMETELDSGSFEVRLFLD